MNYLWTTIHVSSLERSVAFYAETAGLKVLQRFPAGPGIEIAFMGNGKTDETLVELYADSRETAIQQGSCVALGFEVSSAAATLAEFKSRSIPIAAEIFETPKFKWFAVKDPDGLTVQFFEKKQQPMSH